MGLATVAYQRGDLDTAFQHLTEGIPLCRQFVYTPPLATGLAMLAWIRQAQGDPGGALEGIGQAEAAAPGPGVTVPLNPVPVLRARLLLAQGDLPAASRWTTDRGLRPGDEPEYPHEQEYLVLARVLLAQEQPRQVLPLLQRLHAAAVAQGRTGSVIEIQTLLALAHAASGDGPRAVATLADALTMACPQGYVRVFTDEGAPMAVLLRRLIAAQRAHQGPAHSVPLGYLGRAGALLRAGRHRGYPRNAANARPVAPRAWSSR